MTEKFEMVDLRQGSEEWLAWRASRWMASEAAVIMDVAPTWAHVRTWEDLRLEKAGFGPEPSEFVQGMWKRGLVQEQIAWNWVKGYEPWRDAVALMSGNAIPDPIRGGCFTSVQDPRRAASLDGWLQAPHPQNLVGWVEIKCPTKQATWHKGTSVFDKLPQHYQWQVIHQWSVLGEDPNLTCWFVLAPDGDKPRCFRIQPGNDWPERAARLWQEWERWANDDDDALLPEGWRAGASAFKIAEELLAEATQRHDEAKALLIEMSGGKTVSGYGVEVKHGTRAGPLDPELIIEALPDADNYRAPGSFNAIMMKKAGLDPDKFRKPRTKTVTVKVV